MITIWQALLILTVFLPIFQKLFKHGDRIIVDGNNLFYRWSFMILTTFINYFLLIKCSFFVAISWPQVLWIVLTALGFTSITVLLLACWIAPSMIEFIQKQIDSQNKRWGVDFADIFTLVCVLLIYWFGGAFTAAYML